jgi:hypothetical protein
MAGLLAFASPITFFIGDLSMMRSPTGADVTMLGLWWLLFGVELWALLLMLGHASRFLAATPRSLRAAMWFLCASAAAAGVTTSTAGRAEILLAQGVVQSVRAMHLYAFTFSLTMALLYFMHLQRRRSHEVAATRLAAAQAAHREARRRIVQSRLLAVQARIDPELLFEMLEAVRHLYSADARRAENLLDELIIFLRAALPRLRTVSSSLAREAELAGAYARLHALAGSGANCVTLDVATDVMHARLPPGVILPLMADALRSSVGACALTARRHGSECQLNLTLPIRPSEGAMTRVRSVLEDLYGSSSALAVEAKYGLCQVEVRLPYELA